MKIDYTHTDTDTQMWPST